MPIVDWADAPGQVYRFQYQFKRGTTARWFLLNPILEESEPGHEIDTGRFKIGDGLTNWNDLDYFTPGNASGPGGNNGYLFIQVEPASAWIIVHNLGSMREPVVVLDSAPSIPVLTDVEHGSDNQTTIIFPEPVSGKAYF